VIRLHFMRADARFSIEAINREWGWPIYARSECAG
jgi:hypothetical protein